MEHQIEYDIYNPTEIDAGKIWSLKRLLHNEGEFLRLSPQEKGGTINDELNYIQSCKYENKLILIASYKEEVIGYLSAFVDANESKINKVTLGVLQEYQGRGIGAELIKEMEIWACKVKISSIEMNVMAHNLIALGFYQKLGYKIIGTTPTYQLYDSERIVYDHVLKKEIVGCFFNP